MLLRGRMVLGQYILRVSGKRELFSPEWRTAEISSQWSCSKDIITARCVHSPGDHGGKDR